MAEDNTLADISKMGQFINPASTDLESFLPFGNINFQTETSNITNNNVSSTEPNPNRIAQKPEVLPVKVKSFANTKGSPTIKQQHIRDHSVGFPPYDKKQIASTTQDKLNALVAKTQHRSYQHEDNSQYAKSFMYDASSTGAHKARYKAYGQKTFDKIGFNPEINNEEVFNANTSKYDDFVRMATHSAFPMFLNGFTANPKSYANAFGGDFGQDVDEANSYEELSSIGMSTKGGLGGFFNNVFNSLTYTAGIMTEAALEYAAIGAIEGSIVGPEGTVIGGAVGGAAGAIKGLLSVPKSLWNMGKYGGKMLTNLKNLEKFNDAKRLFNTASRTTVNFINPLNNTAQGLKAFTSGDNLSGLARTAKTAGGLFRDVIGMNMALSEGRLEGGFVENNTYNKLYDKFWVEKNRAPTDDEQLEMRKTSKVAGFQDTWKNGLLVLYTNKLAFPELVHGNFMAGASRNVRKVGNEFNVVYDSGKTFFSKAGEKSIKEGAYGIQKFGLKSALKGFVKPGNFVNGSLNYFKVNVVEGAQEVMQDVIGKATEDYYVNSFFDPSKANFDYSMSTLDAAYKSQLSGQGFETFMSGFVMGGLLRPFTGKGFIPRSASILYNKYNMDPATYKTYMEDRKNYATNLANVMNEMHQNPVDFLNERMHNYGSQSIIARNNADDDISTKQRFDNVESSFLSNTLTALQASTHGILNKNMSKYLSLSDVELEETLDLKEGEGAKTRTMLTDYLKKSKNMQEQYDYAQNTFGVKKINLKDLKKRTPEYDKAAIYNKAIDRGIFNLVYLNESFTNNLERVDKIVKSLNKSSLFKNMPSADFQTLLDSNKLSNTIDMLSTEIETLKSLNTPESNRNAIEKEKMLSALSLFSQKQEIYRRNISDNIESLNVLEKDVDNQNIPNKEELNKEIKDLKTIIEESGVEPKQLFKESFENLLKVLSGSDINYQKVLNDLNKKGGVDSLFNDLIDAELLKRESQILIPYINLLSQPASFYEHVERNYEWMRNLYLNRRNYYKEIINKSIIAKENNDLLKSLSDQNIYVDLEDFANWVENPENLPDYFIEATEGNERIIPKGSIAYDNYAYIFINTANMQRESAAGEQVDIDGQFEEALENLLAQKQKEIETADENFKRDLKTETNFSYDELLEQEQEGTEVRKPVSQLTIDRKIAEIDNFLESLISDDPALIQSRIKDFKKNTLIPKEYFNDELLADLQYKNENDQQKLKDVILPIFNSYETSFDKGQRAEVAFDLVGIAELLNNEKERLRTTTEIVTEIEPLDIINKTQSYADYQKVLDAIIKRYEEHINDLKTEFTKKGVVSEDTDNDISLSATWDEIQKQSKELYDILNDKFNSEIGTEFDDEKYDLIRNNWLETQNNVITEFNMKKAAERLIEEAEKKQFKVPVFKYIKIQKGYEIKITSKIEPLINIRNTYEKILEEDSKLTKKQKENLTEDLKELDRVINFIREQGLQQDTTVFDKALQIFNEKIISRQSEIEKVLNDNGELIERKIDGAVAERVTKKAEELNNEITNSEPFLYSWLKDKTETEEIEGVKQDVFVKSFILSTYDAVMSDASINENDKLSLFLESFKLKVLNSAKSNVFRSKNGSTLNPVKFKKIEEELTKDFSRENVIAVLQRAAYQEAADIGNMIDVLIKDFLTREGLQFKKIVKPEKMSQEAFDSLFGDRGIITNFRDGIIDGKFMIVGASDMLFDKSLFENGLVGETDLIAISADGNFSIIDVKALLGKNWSRITAENNLEKLTAKLTKEGKTETEINNNEDVIKLKKDSNFSKKLYFRIQQSIYRNLFYNMTGIMPERISLLPIEVNYDRESNLISAKLSDIVSDEDLSTYELEYFDQVESIVPLKAPIISPVSTIETTDELVEEIGASTSLKDNIGKKVLYNGEVGTLIFNDNGTFSIQIDPIKTYETKTTVIEDSSKQNFTADQDTLKIAINGLKQNLVYEEGEFGNADKANELKEKIAELEKQVIPTTDTKADVERRRQEDLQKGQLFLINDGTYGGSRMVSLNEYSQIQIQENNLDSDVTKWDYKTFNGTGIFVNINLGIAYIVPNNSYNGKKITEIVKVFINKSTKRFDLNNPRIINTPNIELVAKAANIDSKELYNEVLNVITKYDAELAALSTDTKADIERKQGINGVEEVTFSNPNFKLEGFEIDGNYWNVVTSTDRAKVLVNINGVIVPFYLTTGQAGKGLVPGWYPFFGIGKDGWLNKTDKSDMETYYERYWGKETAEIVKSISEELNSFYGTDPSTFKNDGDPNATTRPLSTLADKVEDYINSKLSYTPAINNADARKTLRSNVEQLGKEINANYDAELAALSTDTKADVNVKSEYKQEGKTVGVAKNIVNGTLYKDSIVEPGHPNAKNTLWKIEEKNGRYFISGLRDTSLAGEIASMSESLIKPAFNEDNIHKVNEPQVIFILEPAELQKNPDGSFTLLKKGLLRYHTLEVKNTRAEANTDTKTDINVKKEQSIVEVPTKSKIIDLYYESSAVNDPSLSLNNVGLSQVKETKKVFETIIINNVSYTTRILNKNTVLINDVFYRVNYSGNDANIIASLTYDVNDAEISKLEKEELIILDSINELQNKNKTLSPSKLNEVTPESTNTFNRNVNTIGQLTMDLKNIRQTIKDLNDNNPQRTMRGGNVNDFIFAINSSPQNFKLYAGKSNDERIEDLKEISRLSYSPTLSIKLDEILAKDYPDALNKLFDDGVTSISDSELKAIKTWSNTVLEDLTDLASQVKTRGDISTDVDNQINAINNLINDLQLINLTKNGKISKRNQEESEKVFGQQTVSNRTSVPENEKSGNRKTKGVSGQKTRNVTNDEVKERINETLLNNSLLLGIIPTEEETIIVTSKKGKKFITDIKKATLDNIRTKYIEALTQIETDPSSINTTELNETYNNRLDELNIDMSIENLQVDMVLLPKNVIFDNTNINPVRITKVNEAFVTIKDIITEETGEFNQNELKLNFIKMNEESIESEIENELTEEDIQNAEDSQIIYESFSQDTDAQSKLVDEVENNNVSEDDLLKNFNNNTKLC